MGVQVSHAAPTTNRICKLSIFTKGQAALEAAMPLSHAVKATAPAAPKTQLDIVEDKLDWLIGKINGMKTVSVGVADEDIASLKDQLTAVTAAVAKLSVPPVAVVAPAPAATAVPVAVIATAAVAPTA